MQKPSIPKGTRDFSPEEMAKRNYIFNTIREVYHLYGFQQIETPAMENRKYQEARNKFHALVNKYASTLSIKDSLSARAAVYELDRKSVV